MSDNQVISFLTASIILTLMPGPDIIFVVTQSIVKGFKSAYLFALGLCTGLIAHTLATSLGISFVIKESPILFSIIKYLGIAYLAYLGLKILLDSKKSDVSLNDNKDFKNLYRRGILMNLLNPKVMLFFLAFLPQFVNQNSLHPEWELTLLGLLFIAQALVVFLVVALIAGKLSTFLNKSNKYNRYLSITQSLVFFGIAIWLLFSVH